MPAEARSLIETSPMRTTSSGTPAGCAATRSVIVRGIGHPVVVRVERPVVLRGVLHVSLDHLEQVAERASAACAGLELFLARRAHQAAHLLHVGLRVLLEPVGER